MGSTSVEGWELHRKHIFILSSSGKPIFSRYGDEQELVTTFGLLQAVHSIVQDSGDTLHCIHAGNRKIVYYIKGLIYMICMTFTGEPEAVICKQLQFMYDQMILMLTNKVQSILKNNPSADLRQLLGSDTTRIMHAACKSDLTPNFIVFHAVKSFAILSEVRAEISAHLKFAVEKSGAAMGLLLYKDCLVSLINNGDTQLILTTGEISLLIHFIVNAGSFNQNNEQHWVPICMPEFNANGFLQAYVCNLQVSCEKSSLRSDFSLIFIASSADADVFKELHNERIVLQEKLRSKDLSARMIHAVEVQRRSVDKFIEYTGSLHFLFKLRSHEKTRKTAASFQLPSQFIESTLNFPLDNQSIQESIWTNYQRLALCVRSGASTIESTLFPTTEENKGGVPKQSISSKLTVDDLFQHYKSIDKLKHDEEGTKNMASSPNSDRKKYSILKAFETSKMILSSTSSSTSDEKISGSPKSRKNQGDWNGSSHDSFSSLPNVLTKLPSTDHAFASTVLSSGHTIIALAAFESELYVTFPSTMNIMEASSKADTLSKILKNHSSHLFQIDE